MGRVEGTDVHYVKVDSGDAKLQMGYDSPFVLVRGYSHDVHPLLKDRAIFLTPVLEQSMMRLAAWCSGLPHDNVSFMILCPTHGLVAVQPQDETMPAFVSWISVTPIPNTLVFAKRYEWEPRR